MKRRQRLQKKIYSECELTHTTYSLWGKIKPYNLDLKALSIPDGIWVQKTYPYPALGLHCESVKKEVGVQRQSSTSHSPKTAKFSATSIFLTQTCLAMNTPTNHKIGLAGARAYHQKAGRGQQYVQFFFTNYNAVNINCSWSSQRTIPLDVRSGLWMFWGAWKPLWQNVEL